MKRAPRKADADSGASTLAANYTKLLDERDSLEWPKLFDSGWQDAVLESQDSLLRMAPQLASAIERFIAEFGRTPKASKLHRSARYVDNARRLLRSLQLPGDNATLGDVRLLWLDIAADAQSVGIVSPDPIDRLVVTEHARRRGQLSGAKRRAQRDDSLDRAAAALCELQKQRPFARHTRAAIEAKMNKPLPSRITLTAVHARARELAVKK